MLQREDKGKDSHNNSEVVVEHDLEHYVSTHFVHTAGKCRATPTTNQCSVDERCEDNCS